MKTSVWLGISMLNLLEEFMKFYKLKNLVKGPACLINFDKPSCINLILTNKIKSFQTSQIIETGISDFHKMVMTLKIIRKITFHIMTFLSLRNMFLTEPNVFANMIYKRRLGQDIT